MSLPSLSIVVPMFNEEAVLEDCLTALINQDGIEAEVIAVDNGSRDRTLSLLESFAPQVKIVHEAEKGPLAARNRGVRASTSWAVGFTDADCVPSPSWAKTLLAALCKEGVGIVGGDIFSHPGDNWIGQYEGRYGHAQRVTSRPGEYLPYLSSGNVMMRREVFERVGAFDPRFVAGGDPDLCWRAVQAGFDLKYVEGAAVLHRGATSATQLYFQSYRYARGKRNLRSKHGLPVGWQRRVDEALFAFESLLSSDRPARERSLDFVRAAASLAGTVAGPFPSRKTIERAGELDGAG